MARGLAAETRAERPEAARTALLTKEDLIVKVVDRGVELVD